MGVAVLIMLDRRFGWLLLMQGPIFWGHRVEDVVQRWSAPLPAARAACAKLGVQAEFYARIGAAVLHVTWFNGVAWSCLIEGFPVAGRLPPKRSQNSFYADYIYQLKVIQNHPASQPSSFIEESA